jgi:hypothetical protein
MEYNLLKTIEPNLGLMMSNETLPRLTAYPATDYVNPGLGQITRLFSFYVPLYTQRDLHLTQKKSGDVSAEMLEGKGEETSDNKDNSQETEKNTEDSDDFIEQFNDLKRKKMDPGVFDSFHHPKKIKTDSITFASNSKTKTINHQSPKSTKNVKHKFQFA